MIRPDSAKNFMDAMEKCFLVIQNLKKILQSRKLLTNVGDEGGFAPSINSNEEALSMIVDAIEKSRLKPGRDINICLDVAANELIDKNGDYSLNSSQFISVEECINYYKNLVSKFSISFSSFSSSISINLSFVLLIDLLSNCFFRFDQMGLAFLEYGHHLAEKKYRSADSPYSPLVSVNSLLGT